MFFTLLVGGQWLVGVLAYSGRPRNLAGYLLVSAFLLRAAVVGGRKIVAELVADENAEEVAEMLSEDFGFRTWFVLFAIAVVAVPLGPFVIARMFE